ncbi:MAG: tetratricopeptide repeat protein [Ferruginibacter sp.]
MFKSIIYILLPATFLVISCNNNDSKGTESIPATEQTIRNQIKQYPDSLELHNKLVDYFASNNDYGAALKETNIVIKKDSSNPTLWDAKARLLFLNGDTTGAIDALNRAIEIFPDPQYIISLGTIYAQTNNPLALAMADALLNAPRANAALQALFIKGLYYSYSGDKAQAVSFFDKCLTTDYTFLDAYREKAIALYEMAKYEEALKVLETATTVQKTYEEGWYWMGKCYQKLNKNKEAIESYRMALQFDPEFIEAKDALGKLGVKG